MRQRLDASTQFSASSAGGHNDNDFVRRDSNIGVDSELGRQNDREELEIVRNELDKVAFENKDLKRILDHGFSNGDGQETEVGRMAQEIQQKDIMLGEMKGHIEALSEHVRQMDMENFELKQREINSESEKASIVNELKTIQEEASNRSSPNIVMPDLLEHYEVCKIKNSELSEINTNLNEANLGFIEELGQARASEDHHQCLIKELSEELEGYRDGLNHGSATKHRRNPDTPDGFSEGFYELKKVNQTIESENMTLRSNLIEIEQNFEQICNENHELKVFYLQT